MTVTVHARQSASEHPTESPKSRDPSPHAPHLPKQRTGSADFGKSHPHPKDTSTTYPTLQRPVIDNQTPSDKQHYGRKSDERYPMSSSNNKNWREVSPTSSRSPRSPKSSEGPYRNTRHSNYHHSLSHNDESSKPLDGGSARESTGEEEYKDELVSEDDGREDCDAGRYDDNDGGDEDKLNEDENDNDEEDDGEEEDEEDEEEGTEATDHTPKSDDESSGLVFSMYGARRQTKVRSMFVDKLLKMVEDPSIQHLISWAKEGDMFYVYNCVKLSQYILPKFFKHNNWQSFVRQLNMYGFHKIYRYDREESSMNRKNPETQRWQFYHPHFQREYPHLRKNIKRKSTRTMSAVPTASRVVFEHGKGYFLQREDRSRSNSGEENGTDQPGDKTSPLTDEDNSSMTAPGAPTPRHYSHYATLGSVTNAKSVKAEGMRKERKITETPAITREEGPVYPHHNPAYVKGVHELPQQPYDASGCRPPSFSDRTQGQYPTRYPIDTKSHDRSSAMSINDAFAPAAGSMPPGPPDQHQGTRPRAGTESYLRRQFGQRSDQRHGNMQSQMSLLDSPVAHPDFPMSPSSRDMAPQTSPRSMHTVKLLESRLAFVEDSFASMKQFTQRLESIQASQDRTITWMRERLEQLTDGAQFQGKQGEFPSNATIRWPYVYQKKGGLRA
ncbi:hypothetical protein BG004_000883 [Podila humilis]|nr:hypothetical protein BG004_000883 [Podila humilis]